MKRYKPKWALKNSFAWWLYRNSVLYRLGFDHGYRKGRQEEIAERGPFGRAVSKAVEKRMATARASVASAWEAVSVQRDELLTERQVTDRLAREIVELKATIKDLGGSYK